MLLFNKFLEEIQFETVTDDQTRYFLLNGQIGLGSTGVHITILLSGI